MSFHKFVPQVVIHDVRGTSHSLCMVTSVQIIQKSTRNFPIETWKQVSQWMAEDLRVKTEINRVDK